MAEEKQGQFQCGMPLIIYGALDMMFKEHPNLLKDWKSSGLEVFEWFSTRGAELLKNGR